MDPANPFGVQQVQILNRAISQNHESLRTFLEQLTGDVSTPEQIEALLTKIVLAQTAQSTQVANEDEKRQTLAPQMFHVIVMPESQSREFGYRATAGRWNNFSEGLVLDVHLNTEKPKGDAARPVRFDRAESPDRVPTIVRDILMVLFSSGVTTALYHLLRAWVDKKNGRKIRFKAGDTELDVTQMDETDFMKLFQVLTKWYEEERGRGAVGGKIRIKRK
ncbi:MAG TPA: hypothetical protein VK504_01345 [Vicinamibacterales bacterium]|jgi:hypothetical protein|nr:hypothetical protein [Vicinamibacterales bacterium]